MSEQTVRLQDRVLWSIISLSHSLFLYCLVAMYFYHFSSAFAISILYCILHLAECKPPDLTQQAILLQVPQRKSRKTYYDGGMHLQASTTVGCRAQTDALCCRIAQKKALSKYLLKYASTASRETTSSFDLE